MQTEQDEIYNFKREPLPPFQFDSRVAAVFDDMIDRSVPIYREVQQLTRVLAAWGAVDNSTIYDLGCSTGTSLVAIAAAVGNRPVQIVGIDNSPPMLEQCREKLERASISERIQLEEADVEQFAPADASMIVMNFTLQFIPPEKRQAVLHTMRQSLRPGGVLLLAEKIVSEDPEINSLLVSLHEQFKRENAYSELEIAQKRAALENVLVPLTAAENISLLHAAGFRHAEVVLRAYNFAAIVAY